MHLHYLIKVKKSRNIQKMKPNIQLEDFIKGYRFLRVPRGWAGESFTKAHLLVYLLMKSKIDDKMRLYETSYTVPLTDKFIKHAWEGISLKGRNLKIEDPLKLAEKLVSWDDPNKKVEIDLKKEFEADFAQVMDEVLELQTEARERGWTVLLQEG